MNPTKKDQKITQLTNKLRVLEASQLFKSAAAFKNIDKCGIDRYMGSAVTITIKNINNDKNTIIEEVAISDGLSLDTIAAIKADIERSHKIALNHPINKL